MKGAYLCFTGIRLTDVISRLIHKGFVLDCFAGIKEISSVLRCSVIICVVCQLLFPFSMTYCRFFCGKDSVICVKVEEDGNQGPAYYCLLCGKNSIIQLTSTTASYLIGLFLFAPSILSVRF